MTHPAATSPLDRRALARRLTQALEASAHQSLASFGDARHGHTPRIGITGAPGAGKSTLIDQLALRRIERYDPATGRLAVLAIDPSSPLSRGSILGDRIRMAKVAGDPRFYIRSVPSRRSQDGLCDNVADLLLVLESYRFDEILLETVGVGQAEYAVRNQVDTVVLIIPPNAGDTVQAMKAGIVEIADIIVINKSDLPEADKTRLELSAIIERRTSEADWRTRVLMVSALAGTGIDALHDAIDAHQRWVRDTKSADQVRRERARHHVESLLERSLRAHIANAEGDLFEQPLSEVFQTLARRLAAEAGPASAE